MAPLHVPSRAEPAADALDASVGCGPLPGASVGRGLLPDHKRAAANYWWLLVAAGVMAQGAARSPLAGLPEPALGQFARASLIVSVNIARLGLAEPGLAELVGDVLDWHLRAARRPTLEITETALVHRLALGGRALSRLHDLGCRYAQGDLRGRPDSARDAGRRVARSATATPGAARHTVGDGATLTSDAPAVPRRKPPACVEKGQS